MSYHVRNCSLHHYIFSTKNRVATIREDMQARLWAYMGGIARANGMKALAVGGIADHCHILLSLPPTISVAKAIQLVKSGSSKWVHDETASRRFAWQEGYGAFSIGASQVPATIRYILNQPRHHRKKGFDREWDAILERHAAFMDA
ncbi:MAG TPA: IS200/IS605 family transposase [Candidatus Angelobacter sp.]